MRFLRKISDIFLKLIIIVGMSPLFAALPVPSDKDLPDGNNSWIDIGRIQMYKALSIAAVIMGAGIILGVAYNMFRAYNTASEKSDLGHFFKHVGGGVVMLFFGVGLCYYGYKIVA